MKRALKWLRDNADTIGIGCMWFVAAKLRLWVEMLRDRRSPNRCENSDREFSEWTD